MPPVAPRADREADRRAGQAPHAAPLTFGPASKRRSHQCPLWVVWRQAIGVIGCRVVRFAQMGTLSLLGGKRPAHGETAEVSCARHDDNVDRMQASLSPGLGSLAGCQLMFSVCSSYDVAQPVGSSLPRSTARGNLVLAVSAWGHKRTLSQPAQNVGFVPEADLTRTFVTGYRREPSRAV